MLSVDQQSQKFWFAGQEELLQNHRQIYKYTSSDSCTKILETASLAFRNPRSFNDPFEFSFQLLDFSHMPESELKRIVNDCYSFLNRKERRKLWNAGKDTLIKGMSVEVERLMREDVSHHGLSCFTATYDHLLMWSHYAQSHTGVCIGFDLVELFYAIAENAHPESFVRKVIYQDQPSPIQYMTARLQATIRWMTTKSTVWAYEQEIRIVLAFLTFNPDGLHFKPIPAPSIISLYLGSQIKPADEQVIRNLCARRYPHVKLYSMRLADNVFSLVAT